MGTDIRRLVAFDETLCCLGFGVFEAPTLAMTLYRVNFTGAVKTGWLSWSLEPMAVVGLLFVASFLVSIGVDEVANPRLRRVA